MEKLKYILVWNASKKISSNTNEVIRAILNSFIQKLHNHKKEQNAFSAFYCFLLLFVRAKSFRKKNAKFKTALITISFILPLNF